jgi:hypothetical protein
VGVPATIATYPAGLFYEVAFNVSPNQSAIPPLWTDLSARTKPGQQGVQRGRQYELDVNQAGTWRTALENKDGALDPTNAASPFAPGVVPFRACRIRAQLGVNFLTADQATAGEGSGYLGAVPVQLNVVNDAGYPVTIAASGSAYQGSQVWQAVVPSGQGAGVTVLLVTGVPVVPNTAYSFSSQVRIPSGTSTATSLQVAWFDQGGNQLSTVTGTSATPTSGSAAWVALGASGTAPSTALSASLRIQIASGSTAASTTWQADGLQWEQSATVTPFQVPQGLGANLLPRNIATGTASMAVSDVVGSWFNASAGTLAQASNLPAAPTGQSTALAWTTPTGTTSSAVLRAGSSASGPLADCVQVTAALSYTASLYATRAASADATVQITVTIDWYSAAGGLLSSSAGGAATVASGGAWVRAFASGTAPALAVWGRPRLSITTPATTTATNTIYCAAWQMEQAASASAWVDPGPSYQIFNGLVERWPQSWTMNGAYGVIGAIGIDQLAAIAQYTLLAPFIQEVLAMGPNFFYPLNDPATSTSCADVSGKRPPAPVENSPFGAGSLTFGNSVTATTTPSGLFLGTPGPVATFNNNPSETGSTQFAETFVSIHKTTVSPGPPVNGNWTRILHFRSAAAPTGVAAYILWNAIPPSYGGASLSQIMFSINTGGSAFMYVQGAAGGAVTYAGVANLCDGNWHQLAISCDGSGSVAFYVDGAQVGTGSITLPTSGIAADPIGASIQLGANIYKGGMVGDVACVIELPFASTTAQMTNLYNSWRNASSGDSTGARAQRVLTWIAWPGATALDTGQTTNMGPASDLTGATALDALNAIALTENGNAYASSTGAITLTSRGRRYNQRLPTFVFGENANLGEWPYEDIAEDYDPSRLFNVVQVTQSSTGQVATARDAASQTSNYPRVLQRTINVGAFTEAQDAANYLLAQYKSARLRIANLKLHPAAMSGLMAVCLALEIGTRIRVMRRPPAAPAIQFDGFVESITWSVDPVSGKVFVNLQCSPADLAAYWLVAATRTTLNAQATSGQGQATINALPDAAVNALSSSLPQQYQLTFEPGTPRAETMTLAVGGIPATSVGYQSAILTFTTNFGFTHAAGTTVCEPLPAGVTDPAAYDATSALGASSCTLLSGGGSGTATVTVGPLGDAKVNGLGSNWNTGDLLAISPGTANYEGYNALTPNQATAGEGVLPLAAGTAGSVVGVTSALGTMAVTASGTAQQGANVWQVPVPGAASLSRLLRVNLVPAAAGLAHTWSVYVRSVTAGANPVVNPQIVYFDANGNTLATTNGGTSTLTGATSAAWTRISVTATAPAGTVWASLGVPLNAAAPAGAWSFQADALQWEQAASASVFCVTPQVKSVAAAVPGYSSVTITLNTNLLNTHTAGDVVCDQLPPGVTVPPAGSMRLAY